MKKLPMKERIDQVSEKYKSEPYRCEQELKRLLKEAEREADLYSIGLINMLLANCIIGQGKRGSMLAYAYKAVSIFEKMNEPALLARSYNLMGIAYSGQGGLDCAMAAYRKALHLVGRRNFPTIRRDTLLNNIGDAYFQMGAYHKSLRMAIDGYASCRKTDPKNLDHIIVFGTNIFDSYCYLGEFQKARDILDDFKQEAETQEKNIFVCGYYTRLSYILYTLGDAEDGAKNADVVLDLVHSKLDSYEYHTYFEKIASYQIKLGDLDRARRISQVLKAYADENGHLLDHIISKRVQAAICFATDEWPRALALNKEISAHYETLLHEKRAVQYESQQSVEMASKEIGKLMQRIRDSEQKADRDPMTGLMNRAAMVSVTTGFIQNARDSGGKLGGIFLDIDYFKGFNDTYGHAAGDEAIKLVARICLEEENQSVKFFRYGGDEYFGVMLGVRDKELERIALRISEKVRSSGVAHIKNPNGHLTVSVGVVNLNMKASAYTILDVVKYADKALYQAKDAGKNTVYMILNVAGPDHTYRRVE